MPHGRDVRQRDSRDGFPLRAAGDTRLALEDLRILMALFPTTKPRAWASTNVETLSLKTSLSVEVVDRCLKRLRHLGYVLTKQDGFDKIRLLSDQECEEVARRQDKKSAVNPEMRQRKAATAIEVKPTSAEKIVLAPHSKFDRIKEAQVKVPAKGVPENLDNRTFSNPVGRRAAGFLRNSAPRQDKISNPGTILRPQKKSQAKLGGSLVRKQLERVVAPAADLAPKSAVVPQQRAEPLAPSPTPLLAQKRQGTPVARPAIENEFDLAVSLDAPTIRFDGDALQASSGFPLWIRVVLSPDDGELFWLWANANRAGCEALVSRFAEATSDRQLEGLLNDTLAAVASMRSQNDGADSCSDHA